MISFSRRTLAKYAVEGLLAGESTAKIAKNLAAVLASEGKQKEVDFLLADIDNEMEQRSLMAKANVTSVYPISAQLRGELESAIKKATGVEKVIMENKIDEGLIGGIKVETSTRSWDKSLKRELSTLKENT